MPDPVPGLNKSGHLKEFRQAHAGHRTNVPVERSGVRERFPAPPHTPPHRHALFSDKPVPATFSGRACSPFDRARSMASKPAR
jgi:hypothetical protein